MDPIQKETILEEKSIRIWLTKYEEEVLIEDGTHLCKSASRKNIKIESFSAKQIKKNNHQPKPA